MGAASNTGPPRRRIRWRNKHYLSVVMVGALVAIALVAAISISLAPAHLIFYIPDAKIAIYGPLIDNHSNYTHLNFTLEVYNSSPRTAVWYGPITGEISYGPAAAKAWIRYGIRGSEQLAGMWQKPLSSVRFAVSADYGYNEKTQGAVDSSRILVVAEVRFAWLGMPTRPYTVQSSCERVNFKDATNFPVICA